jgi:hypothetical protein
MMTRRQPTQSSIASEQIEAINVRLSVHALKYYANLLRGFHTWDFVAAPLSKMKLLRVIEPYI